MAAAGRKCYSFNTQFSVFIGDCVRVCESKISICNRWELEEFKTTCKLVFNRFWKPLVSSLYFLYKPNQTKWYIWTYVIANNNINNKKLFNAEIRLPNSNWFDRLCFLPFKQFSSNWSLWGNSTYPDESRRVEIPRLVDVLLNTVIEFKVAEHSFRARFGWCNSARAQGFDKTN